MLAVCAMAEQKGQVPAWAARRAVENKAQIEELVQTYRSDWGRPSKPLLADAHTLLDDEYIAGVLTGHPKRRAERALIELLRQEVRRSSRQVSWSPRVCGIRRTTLCPFRPSNGLFCKLISTGRRRRLPVGPSRAFACGARRLRLARCRLVLPPLLRCLSKREHSAGFGPSANWRSGPQDIWPLKARRVGRSTNVNFARTRKRRSPHLR